MAEVITGLVSVSGIVLGLGAVWAVIVDWIL